MEFGEMKRNTSNWSNFGMLLRRAGLTASAGLSCSLRGGAKNDDWRAWKSSTWNWQIIRAQDMKLAQKQQTF